LKHRKREKKRQKKEGNKEKSATHVAKREREISLL